MFAFRQIAPSEPTYFLNDPIDQEKKRLIGNKQIFLFIIRLDQSESLSLCKREIQRLYLW